MSRSPTHSQPPRKPGRRRCRWRSTSADSRPFATHIPTRLHCWCSRTTFATPSCTASSARRVVPTGRWLIEGEVAVDALKEAILGACGDVDPLESPDIKGRREAGNRLTGFTRREREKFKGRLLEVTAADLKRVAGKYLARGRYVQATVAGPELVEAALRERPGLFEVVAPV